MIVKENIEWTRIWSVDCNDSTKKRILLVGDSICDGYYETVYDILKEDYAVDKLVTSRSIESDIYAKQLSTHLRDFQYDLVCFNNGLHGFHLSAQEYKEAYKKIIDMLLESKVILLKSTPVVQSGTLDQYHSVQNPIVLERNAVVEQLGKQYGLKVCDLYSFVDGKPEIRSEDGVHYNEDGYKMLGTYIAEQIN